MYTPPPTNNIKILGTYVTSSFYPMALFHYIPYLMKLVIGQRISVKVTAWLWVMGRNKNYQPLFCGIILIKEKH